MGLRFKRQKWRAITEYLVIVHRRVADDAKTMNIFLSADPGGIGSAFHRAGTTERKKMTF